MEKLEKSINNVLANKDIGMQELISSFVEEAVSLTNSKIGYFAVMNAAEDTFVMVGWSKTAMDNCSLIDKPIVYKLVDTGIWGDAARERKPIITNDYINSKKPTKKGHPAGHVPVLKHFNIPIFEGKHIAGVLGVGNKLTDYMESDVKNLEKYVEKLWTIIKKQIPNELLQ
jgi:hypothetical protein